MPGIKPRAYEPGSANANHCAVQPSLLSSLQAWPLTLKYFLIVVFQVRFVQIEITRKTRLPAFCRFCQKRKKKIFLDPKIYGRPWQ